VWFAGVLFVAELTFDLSWIYVRLNLQQSWWRWLLFGSVRTDIVWIGTVVFFSGLAWYRTRKRRELDRLLQMREQILGVG